MIQEPTLEHFAYYLRRLEGDTPRGIQEKRRLFEQQLEARRAQLEGLSGQSLPAWNWPEEVPEDFPSQLVWSTGWIAGPAGSGRTYFAAAYIYHDVYCLQTGCCQSGQSGPEIYADLLAETGQQVEAEHWLGCSNYLCGIAAGGADKLAARALAAFMGRAPGKIMTAYLADCDSWLYGLLQEPGLSVLFYPNPEREAWVGAELLNDRIPRLELYRHKIKRQLDWCRDNQVLLSGQGQELAGLLEATETGLQPDDHPSVQQIAWLYQIYDGNARMLEDRLTTIGTNLRNLDVVLEEFGNRSAGELLREIQDELWERRRAVATALGQAQRIRERGAAAIEKALERLGLDSLADLLQGQEDLTQAAGVLAGTGFPGTASPYDPAAPFPLLEIQDPEKISLDARDCRILQHVYRGMAKLRILKRFTSGFACRHVLLVQPVTEDGRQTALRVVKIASAPDLLVERDNYCKYVEDLVHNSAAVQEWQRYYAEDDLAGLGYKFVGGGGLGETVELDEYYRRAAAAGDGARVCATLDRLLAKELGEWWYRQTTDHRDRTFQAEYGPDLLENLRIRIRPGSADALWPPGQAPARLDGYRRVPAGNLPALDRDLRPGDCLLLEGLVVRKVKGGVAKLQDSEGRGIVVRVELGQAPPPAHDQQVGLCGEVLFTRHGRMRQVVCEAFPELEAGIEGARIALPGVPGTFPNPLLEYPALLNKIVEPYRESCVHGDLHMHNVLVDEVGFGRLIDFAEVGVRHNLFDFIKLETYIRYLRLSRVEPAMPWDDYVRFEESLIAAMLGEAAEPPRHAELRFAQEIILEIRRIACQFLVSDADLVSVYLPALFLYCLALTRYYQPSARYGTQLAFVTACVAARRLR